MCCKCLPLLTWNGTAESCTWLVSVICVSSGTHQEGTGCLHSVTADVAGQCSTVAISSHLLLLHMIWRVSRYPQEWCHVSLVLMEERLCSHCHRRSCRLCATALRPSFLCTSLTELSWFCVYSECRSFIIYYEYLLSLCGLHFSLLFFFPLLLFFAVLGFKLRASHLLGNHSTAGATSPVLFL
jgi:hypothetical protein